MDNPNPKEKNMSKSKLMVHVDTNRVPRETVLLVPPPEATDSYRPVAHKQFLELMLKNLEQAKLKVLDEEYSLNKEGTKMFGVLDIESRHDRNMLIGIRNSHDGSMAMGITAGERVTVCDNLAFSGQYVEMRKHTSGVTDEGLDRMVKDSIIKVQRLIQDFSMWITTLRAVKFQDDRHVKALMLDGVAEGVISVQGIKKLLKAYTEEKKLSGEPDLYTFYQAYTRSLRGKSLFSVAENCKGMNAFIDRFTTFADIQVQ
jgi:hypothetical protein